MKKKTNQSSFKTDLQRLEEISSLLENNELDLEEAIALYEEGIHLSKKCLETLTVSELKVNELKAKIDSTNDDLS
ncbi:MAG: exodeoxyribonuclease VII small subunit [Ignavibacteria bacterium CG_4_8_14_3_um_filter_37_9]|nr:exodeoxyribonuclease VII small subunit [Ignavibacteria bacterium]OIO15134.1 MAG: exodeoxyribonuclease VII small subunit [Ignavibacteria bacterium CG1_02_37_35]PIP78762.1 MAG: exodeoxyribonuclease VII small subunit [Ignavibacteria bacterium CG22_combo_CG10-13_8_21_14_all_37_15]PIS45371.1 MAG: exodeoxyribonuclease VII small subunit [Ignavibacteria bacterium CG08_land_8_20_14_0_20_37_9]PIW98376.1 MAG: exodeoxyribonuclease VII small subunit [Ignavibacteria bacterium CG_4_8_14_3_um_filter_37_9]P